MTIDFATHAAEHPWYWIMAYNLSRNNDCFMCNKRLDEAIVIPSKVKNHITISGLYAFHIESTHGIPAEFLQDWICQFILQSYEAAPNVPPTFHIV